MDNNITFGIELEISDGYGASSYDGPFERTYDSSVSGDELEFKSPILRGRAGLETVADFCQYMYERDWCADDTCGYHLHLGVEHLTDEQCFSVIAAYTLSQKEWLALHPERQFTDWCNPIRGYWDFDALTKYPTFRDFARAVPSRYCWVNPCAYLNHGTIEIRLHEGTTDAERIINWIVAHVTFVAKFSRMSLAEVTDYFLTHKLGDALETEQQKFYRLTTSEVGV